MPAYKTADEKPHPGFLNTREAGEILGITASSVCRYIRLGRLTALAKQWYCGKRLRTAYFIPINEIKRFGMQKVLEKYAKPNGWVRAKDDPNAILREGT